MVEPVEFITNLTGCGVEQWSQQLNGIICAACEERTFTAETPFPLSGEGETVLDITGSFLPGTSSVHTGQHDAAGTLAMQLCSRAAGTEQLTIQTKDVPVTQTLDLPNAAEGRQCGTLGRSIGLHPDCDKAGRRAAFEHHMEAAR